MMEDIIDRLKAVPGKVSFYYKNLVTGDTASLNEDMPMMSASVIKLFVCAECYRQISQGKISKDDPVIIRREDCVPSCGAIRYMHDGLQVTIEDLYTLMLILSDNSATNYLIDILGADNINEGIRSLGYKTSTLNRKMYEVEKSRRGIQNYITAAEVGDLLERLYLGTLVSPEASADMISILKEQQVETKIPFVLTYLPEEVVMAHKTGEDDGITHDVGIIYAKQPFVVVFSGNEVDVPQLNRLMADLSYELYMMNNV